MVGTILLAAVGFNMAILPYPNWFWINLIIFPMAFIGGAKVGQGRTTTHIPADDSSASGMPTAK